MEESKNSYIDFNIFEKELEKIADCINKKFKGRGAEIIIYGDGSWTTEMASFKCNCRIGAEFHGDCIDDLKKLLERG